MSIKFFIYNDAQKGDDVAHFWDEFSLLNHVHPTRTFLHNKDDALGQEIHNEACFITVALLSGKLWPGLSERCTIIFLFLPPQMTSTGPYCPDDPSVDIELYFKHLVWAA